MVPTYATSCNWFVCVFSRKSWYREVQGSFLSPLHVHFVYKYIYIYIYIFVLGMFWQCFDIYFNIYVGSVLGVFRECFGEVLRCFTIYVNICWEYCWSILGMFWECSKVFLILKKIYIIYIILIKL